MRPAVPRASVNIYSHCQAARLLLCLKRKSAAISFPGQIRVAVGTLHLDVHVPAGGLLCVSWVICHRLKAHPTRVSGVSGLIPDPSPTHITTTGSSAALSVHAYIWVGVGFGILLLVLVASCFLGDVPWASQACHTQVPGVSWLPPPPSPHLFHDNRIPPLGTAHPST